MADIDFRPGVENHDAAARARPTERSRNWISPHIRRPLSDTWRAKSEENLVGTIARGVDQCGDVAIGVADHALRRHLAKGPADPTNPAGQPSPPATTPVSRGLPLATAGMASPAAGTAA